jgi:LmbE family N-acetylglucosaminyl deacetylase
MFKVGSKILVLAPHTDDGEMGCGGTMHKLSQNGNQISYVAFSSCAESIQNGLPLDTLVHEVKQATLILGVKPENLHILDFKVRRFSEKRQDILEYLVALKHSLRPDVIFCPSTNDIHQDHSVIANEAIRAFKNSTILAYEGPWNNLKFENRCFVELSEDNIARKIESLQAYKSQNNRSYMTEEFLRSLAHVRGVTVQKRYAEVFDVVSMIID